MYNLIPTSLLSTVYCAFDPEVQFSEVSRTLGEIFVNQMTALFIAEFCSITSKSGKAESTKILRRFNLVYSATIRLDESENMSRWSLREFFSLFHSVPSGQSQREAEGGEGNAIHNSSPAQMLCHYPDVNSISAVIPNLPETMHTYYLAV